MLYRFTFNFSDTAISNEHNNGFVFPLLRLLKRINEIKHTIRACSKLLRALVILMIHIGKYYQIVMMSNFLWLRFLFGVELELSLLHLNAQENS